MRILIPIKRVPAPETKIRLLPDGSGIDPTGVTWVINPFDEIALEEALRIKERGEAEELVCITIGGEVCVEQLRSALAMGADRALLVRDDRPLDPRAISIILHAAVLREQPQLVIMGKQAIDDDSNQVGQRLAARLGWPQATFVSCLTLLDGATRADCVRETDRGLETVRIEMPAVVTTDLRLNEPRYVSLPGIMRARNKPLQDLTCADLGIDVAPRVRTVRLDPPPSRPAGVRLESVDELVTRLREEARVI